MPVKKSRLGLLNPVMSEHKKYLISLRESTELVQAVTGGGELSNDDQLRTLIKERRDGKKYRDVADKSKIKGLLINLKGTDKRLLLHAKRISAWMSVHGTTV